MTRIRRTAQRARTASRHGLGRPLAALLLLVGLVATQGAALTHAHVDAADHEPCAACRIADDASHAIDALPGATFTLAIGSRGATAPAPAATTTALRSAHPPRAPPFV